MRASGGGVGFLQFPDYCCVTLYVRLAVWLSLMFGGSMEGMEGLRVSWLVGLVLGVLSFGSCPSTGWADIVVIPNLCLLFSPVIFDALECCIVR
jgi:hypothetical protein